MTINFLQPFLDMLNDNNRLLLLDKDDYLITSFAMTPPSFSDDCIENHPVFNMNKTIRCYINCLQTIPIGNLSRINLYYNLDDLVDITAKIVTIDEWKSYIRKNIQKEVDVSLNSDDSNNLKLIKEELERDKWNFVNINDEVYLLIGALSSDEDYYYLTLDSQRKFILHSCVGGYEALSNQVIDNKMSTLNWLLINDKTSLIELVNEFLKDNVDVLISEI